MSFVSPKRLIYVPYHTVPYLGNAAVPHTVLLTYRIGFPIFVKKLFRGKRKTNETTVSSEFRLFRGTKTRMISSRVLASHRGGPGSIHDWDMSVLGPLV